MKELGPIGGARAGGAPFGTATAGQSCLSLMILSATKYKSGKNKEKYTTFKAIKNWQ